MAAVSFCTQRASHAQAIFDARRRLTRCPPGVLAHGLHAVPNSHHFILSQLVVDLPHERAHTCAHARVNARCGPRVQGAVRTQPRTRVRATNRLQGCRGGRGLTRTKHTHSGKHIHQTYAPGETYAPREYAPRETYAPNICTLRNICAQGASAAEGAPTSTALVALPGAAWQARCRKQPQGGGGLPEHVYSIPRAHRRSSRDALSRAAAGQRRLAGRLTALLTAKTAHAGCWLPHPPVCSQHRSCLGAAWSHCPTHSLHAPGSAGQGRPSQGRAGHQCSVPRPCSCCKATR